MTRDILNQTMAAFAEGLRRNGIPPSTAPRLDELADAAVEVAAQVEAAIDALHASREALTELLAKAADTPATIEQSEAKVQMLHVWRGTIDTIDRALLTLGRKP
jgi:hypothetical protein